MAASRVTKITMVLVWKTPELAQFSVPNKLCILNTWRQFNWSRWPWQQPCSQRLFGALIGKRPRLGLPDLAISLRVLEFRFLLLRGILLSSVLGGCGMFVPLSWGHGVRRGYCLPAYDCYFCLCFVQCLSLVDLQNTCKNAYSTVGYCTT